MYIVSPKNIPNIFDCNLKKDYQILIIFTRIFTTQLAIKWPLNFPLRPKSASTLPGGKQNWQNIEFLSKAVLLGNQNNTKKTFYPHFCYLANSLSNCLFCNCLQ